MTAKMRGWAMLAASSIALSTVYTLYLDSGSSSLWTDHRPWRVLDRLFVPHFVSQALGVWAVCGNRPLAACAGRTTFRVTGLLVTLPCSLLYALAVRRGYRVLRRRRDSH